MCESIVLSSRWDDCVDIFCVRLFAWRSGRKFGSYIKMEERVRMNRTNDSYEAEAEAEKTLDLDGNKQPITVSEVFWKKQL